MGNRTGIEWTDATWNPVTGCTKVSSGCDNCYAESFAKKRLSRLYRRRRPQVDSDANRQNPFAVRLWPERLEQPLRWQKPRTVFVNSMSDLFHVDVPREYVAEVFEIMLREDRHIYQILTKRPGRAARFWNWYRNLIGAWSIPSHIWMGTSVENQRVVYRADHLKRLEADVRFLSCEPLIGPLRLELDSIHWVIVGGESGPGYRHFKEEWAIALKEQCADLGIPFFFKQVGGTTPKANGRTLDGKEWDQMPFDRVIVAK